MFDNAGNQYALKWTFETVKEHLDKIEDKARSGEAFYLTEALVQLRVTRRAWSYWKERFEDTEEIADQMGLIEGLFEIRLFEAAKLGEIPQALAIFALKNNHQWTDRQEMEARHKSLPVRTGMVVELSDRTIVLP